MWVHAWVSSEVSHNCFINVQVREVFLDVIDAVLDIDCDITLAGASAV
jgi:hypothetical protein